MNSKLENSISMYYKVIEFFAKHLSTLQASAPALGVNINNFSNQMLELDSLIITADKKTNGYFMRKHNLRTEMQSKALCISGALNAHGIINNNEPLAARAYATKNSLDGKRDRDVLYFCKGLHNLATKYAEEVTAMGINADKITAFDTAISTYKAVVEDPDDNQQEGTVAFEEADDKVEEIERTLKITDAIMLAIRPEHSVLYNQYRADRLLEDYANSMTYPDVIEIIEARNTETIFEVKYSDSRCYKIKNNADRTLQWALSEDGINPTNAWRTIGPKSTSMLQSNLLGARGNMLIVNNYNDTSATIELTVVE